MTPRTRKTENPKRRFQLPAEFGTALVLAIVCVVFAFTAPHFRDYDNFRLLSKQAAQLAFLAAGMTLVIATGGIDISVGSLVSLCSMILGWLCVSAGWNIWAACAAAVIVGAAIGVVNGLLIARGKLAPIVVTLATMAIARAAASLFNGGHSISGFPVKLNETFDLTNIAGQPLLMWLGAASLAAGALVLKKTTFGRQVLALGGNRESARLSGNPIIKIETLVYAISGAAAGAAAVLSTAHSAAATPDAGQYRELTAITAVVLGGTAITGGRATMLGTALGVVTITVLANGVRLMGQEDRLSWFLVGAALLLAVEAQRTRGRAQVRPATSLPSESSQA